VIAVLTDSPVIGVRKHRERLRAARAGRAASGEREERKKEERKIRTRESVPCANAISEVHERTACERERGRLAKQDAQPGMPDARTFSMKREGPPREPSPHLISSHCQYSDTSAASAF
jgi:hypothetical protein